MKIGDKVAFWCYQNIDEGDVHFGTLLAIHGDRATIKEGNRVKLIIAKWIF